MSNTWMIRSSGGELIDDFRKGYAALGFGDIGDLTQLNTPEALRAAYEKANPGEKPGTVNSAVAMLRKFRSTIQLGDHVVTYDPQARRYLLGTVESDYFFKPGVIPGHSHLRRVKWTNDVSRDSLSIPSRNSLGSTLTLFAVADDIWEELLAAAKSPSATTPVEEEKEQLEETKNETREKAHELIKDKILQLSDFEMQELAAAILRAMGFKTRISERGPDRGVDVLASPDGLGLQEPRIKVEVKHRSKTTIGAQDVRSFLGGLRPADRGLYISTGGFTKEAKYEAERSNTPATLIDLDDLAQLVVSHYDNFDLEGRALIALVKVYWPAE